jgi:hypothetical protein
MPTYCTLADAYGPEWGKGANTPPNKQAEEKRVQQYQQVVQKAQTAPQGEEIDVKNGNVLQNNIPCPSCQNCLHQNNQFQQKVIDQAIRPLPRWIPQTPNIQAWDPFTRYFAPKEQFGNVPFGFGNRVEHFGNLNTANATNLMQLVLYLLIALFVIQLFELISSL